jgi:deoxyribonuclease V
MDFDPWPATPDALIAIQLQLAAAAPEPWRPVAAGVGSVGGCFVCFGRGRQGPGAAGDPGWAAAALMVNGRLTGVAVIRGNALAGYAPGLLALREGPLLDAAVRSLPDLPDVLIVGATGRDHPRRAGLALHLGARLSVPTVGVTTRPLVAEGTWPPDTQGAISPLRIRGEHVGCWVRTKQGTRPLAVHAAWRTDPDTATAVVLAVMGDRRTPEPLRQARRAAREARARDLAQDLPSGD